MTSLTILGFPARLLGLAIASLLVLSLPGCSGQTTYTLIPTRQPPDDLLRNTVQLQCRNDNTSQTLSFDDAIYWVDNTDQDLRDLLQDKESQTPTRIGTDTLQFTITQNLEGRYFCGPDIRQTSPMELLIAYPPFTDGGIDSMTMAVQLGMTATLPPLISPGALLELYFVAWRRNSTSVTLVQVEVPRDEDTMTNGRYSVHPNSFALTIQSVEFEDRGLYLGELGVRDGPGGQRLMDERLAMIGITLEVYAPPTFLQSPVNQVVSTVDTQSVNFTCRVQAYPRPTITWYNEEEQISDGGRYMISETDSMQDGLPVVWSMVIVSGLTSRDSGRIRCVATISVQPEQQPPAEERTAYLSVLGQVKDVSTFITIQNGTIFRLFLFRPIEAEVQLYINYTDLESRNTTAEITQSRYSRSEEIAFFIENVPQSYQRFYIDVALMSGDLRGPTYRDSTIHDLTVPTELSVTLVQYLVPSLCALLMLVTLSITAITVVCMFFCAKQCILCCRFNGRLGDNERRNLAPEFSEVTQDQIYHIGADRKRLSNRVKELKKDKDRLTRQNEELNERLMIEERNNAERLTREVERLSNEIDRLKMKEGTAERVSDENDSVVEATSVVNQPSDAQGGPPPPEANGGEGLEDGKNELVKEINPLRMENGAVVPPPGAQAGAPPPRVNGEEGLEEDNEDQQNAKGQRAGTPEPPRCCIPFCCRETRADREARKQYEQIRLLYNDYEQIHQY